MAPDTVKKDAEQPEEACPDQVSSAHKRNAFSELMSPKAKSSKPTPTPEDSKKSTRSTDPRHGLFPYIEEPENFPANWVIAYNKKAVLIQDNFPKATVHLLLLPRDPNKWSLNPRDAFDDPVYLAIVKEEANDAIKLAAAELARLISPYSKSCQARMATMESDDPPADLPPGRDFSSDLMVGIHAHPSMHHLHVHIISRDMHSDWLKHRKHYNSFHTEFFIPLNDFPLAKDDPRRDTSYQNANLKKEYICWRCHKNFSNKFTQLKAHLEEEFKAWRKE